MRSRTADDSGRCQRSSDGAAVHRGAVEGYPFAYVVEDQLLDWWSTHTVPLYLDVATGIEVDGLLIAFESSDTSSFLITDLQLGADAAALNGGAGPDFEGTTDNVCGASARWTYGVVVSFLGSDSLTAGRNHILDLTIGTRGTSEAAVRFVETDECSDPPVETAAVIDGVAVPGVLSHGSITVDNLVRRGDLRGDGDIDIRDVDAIVWMLEGSRSWPCPMLGDVNSDGSVDNADVTYLFDYLFNGGPEPAEPFDEMIGESDFDCDLPI